MSFGKKSKRFPESVKSLDFNELEMSKVRVFGEYMGISNIMRTAPNHAGRRQFLKEVCERDWERAQAGYEIIILMKSNDTSKEVRESDVVKGLYSTVTQLLEDHRAAIAGKAGEAVAASVAKVMGDLKLYAKKALDEAADRKVPLVIKDGGKLRKVKGVLPPEFKIMVELASARIPIMLVGPSGCGKTYLSEKLAEALGLECSDQSCSEGMSENIFNGYLLPIGKGGAFEHVTSPFMDRYETGGGMLLDEIDAGDPNLFTYINKAIANSSYTVAQRWQKPVVKKHHDFYLIAAANTYGHGADSMYVGRNQLDAATLDRFKVGLITMDYCPEVEESLASKELLDWAWAIRGKIRQNKLRRVMSTRVIKDLATMTERYEWRRTDWERAYFTGWSDADRRQVAV